MSKGPEGVVFVVRGRSVVPPPPGCFSNGLVIHGYLYHGLVVAHQHASLLLIRCTVKVVGVEEATMNHPRTLSRLGNPQVVIAAQFEVACNLGCDLVISESPERGMVLLWM